MCFKYFLMRKVLKAYKRNPRRFKEIIDIANHIDIDRSDLMKLLLERPKLKTAINVIASGLAGAGAAAAILPVFNYFSKNPNGVYEYLIAGLAGLAGGIAAGGISYVVCGARSAFKYDLLVGEAQRNGYRPYQKNTERLVEALGGWCDKEEEYKILGPERKLREYRKKRNKLVQI